MRLRQRRRAGTDQVPALTPLQVARLRERGDMILARIVIAFTIAAIFVTAGIEGAMWYFNVDGIGALRLSTGTGLVLYATGLVLAWRGKVLAAALIFLATSTGAIVFLVSQISTALSLESFLFGMAAVAFLLLSREPAALRLGVSVSIMVAYVSSELVWTQGTERIEIEGEAVEVLAQMNRVGAALLLASAGLLIERRMAMTTYILAGAARYGELRATTDELTGLYNRRPVLAQLSEWSQRTYADYAIAIVDIDRFKDINDEFGHDCGDGVIQRIAGVLQSHFRASDMVSRWGGDEFLILVSDVRGNELPALLERLRVKVTSIGPTCGLAHDHEVAISIGAALGVKGQTPDQCIAAADQALYSAKESGRNRVAIAPEGMKHHGAGSDQVWVVASQSPLDPQPKHSI